jgi:hypothetical protein
MTSVTAPSAAERYDVRTMVGGGVKLGVVTAVGVAVFALLSRGLEGSAEVLVQSILILVGGVVFTYAPAFWVRPRSLDAIAWTATLGLLGSVAFTVVDTAVLRPLGLYHWTWDAIGGGSGFWYIPIWWMGATFLAWLGGWIASREVPEPSAFGRTAAKTAALALGFGLVLGVAGVAPFHAATVALAYVLGLVAHLALSVVSARGE